MQAGEAVGSEMRTSHTGRGGVDKLGREQAAWIDGPLAAVRGGLAIALPSITRSLQGHICAGNAYCTYTCCCV